MLLISTSLRMKMKGRGFYFINMSSNHQNFEISYNFPIIRHNNKSREPFLCDKMSETSDTVVNSRRYI